ERDVRRTYSAAIALAGDPEEVMADFRPMPRFLRAATLHSRQTSLVDISQLALDPLDARKARLQIFRQRFDQPVLRHAHRISSRAARTPRRPCSCSCTGGDRSSVRLRAP